MNFSTCFTAFTVHGRELHLLKSSAFHGAHYANNAKKVLGKDKATMTVGYGIGLHLPGQLV
jgi:hypothetical protein